MLRNLNKSSAGRRILGTPNVGLNASRILAETASGDHGPGLLYDEAQANPGKQLRLRITSLPGSGGLTVSENGSFELVGAADGAYSIGYDWYADNLIGGSDVATIAVGAINSSAPGAVLTGASTLVAGQATGDANIDGSASGATLNGTSTMNAGQAAGDTVIDASAPGATLNGASSITPGAAAGNLNGTAPGAALNGTGAIMPGQAAGDHDGQAAGAEISGASTLDPGSASNHEPPPIPFDATAFLTRLATLTAVAHRAIGQPWTVGESARLNIVAADHEGNPYDPDALRLLVKPPAAAVTTYDKPEFTRDQAGIYHIEIPLDLAGNWYYSVQIVGQAVIEGAIAVQPSRFVQS